MREGHLRRRHRQPSQRLGEQDGILRREPPLGARGERRGSEPVEAVALRREPLAQPGRRLLHPAVLGEPPGELLGRLLRLELVELGALLGEQVPCLDLEQRRDEHEELAARFEVELVSRRQVLDESDDDRCDVDLGRLQLILEDQREEQVERALERVEVQLEIANRRRHAATLVGGSDALAARNAHLAHRGRRPGARPAGRSERCERTYHAAPATIPMSDIHALIRRPASSCAGSTRSSSIQKRPKQ